MIERNRLFTGCVSRRAIDDPCAKDSRKQSKFSPSSPPASGLDFLSSLPVKADLHPFKQTPHFSNYRKARGPALAWTTGLDGKFPKKTISFPLGSQGIQPCDLAMFYFMARRKSLALNCLDSVVAIDQSFNFPGQLKGLRERFDRFLVESPQSARKLVSNTRFGEYVCALANALPDAKRGLPTTTNALLFYSGRVAAFHVSKKIDGQGSSYLSASLYDAVRHALPRRIELPDAESFRSMTLKDFQWLFDGNFAMENFPEKLVGICMDVDLDATRVESSSRTTEGSTQDAFDLNGLDFHLVLSMGLLSTLQAMLQKIRDIIHEGGVHSVAPLLNFRDALGWNGLEMAIRQGQVAAVTQFVDFLCGVPLPAQIRHELLASAKIQIEEGPHGRMRRHLEAAVNRLRPQDRQAAHLDLPRLASPSGFEPESPA